MLRTTALDWCHKLQSLDMLEPHTKFTGLKSLRNLSMVACSEDYFNGCKICLNITHFSTLDVKSDSAHVKTDRRHLCDLNSNRADYQLL